MLREVDSFNCALVYGPKNESDDYTQVIAYINAEFAKIQQEEQVKAGGITQEIAQEVAQEITQEKGDMDRIEDKIANLMTERPEINRTEIAKILGITADGKVCPKI